MSELRKPFVKLTAEEAQAELRTRNAIEENLRKDYDKILASRFKNPEEKQYIILVRSEDPNSDGIFLECIGRSSAYKEAKELAMGNMIDLNNSIILVEGNTLETSISVLRFLKAMQNIFADGFNVEEYWGDDCSNVKPQGPTAVDDTAQVSAVYDPNANEESIDV